MGRSILAVLVGFILMAVLALATDQVMAFAISNFDQMTVKPHYYYVISLVTGLAYAIVGGWTCASMARTDVQPSMKAMVILGEIIGIGAAVVFWRSVPHYYPIGLLTLYPVSVQFGANSYVWTRPITGIPPQPLPSGQKQVRP